MAAMYKPVTWNDLKTGDTVFIRGRCGGAIYYYGPYTVVTKYNLRNDRLNREFTQYPSDDLFKLS